ncbi:MAG: anti-sigma factor family protein [Nitrospiraceae bacterium]
MIQDPNEQATPEITCQEVAEWTSAYLDSHAGEDRNVRIALHLAACAGCEAYVKQIASVRDLVGLLPKVGTMPADPDRLRQAFAAQHRKR